MCCWPELELKSAYHTAKAWTRRLTCCDPVGNGPLHDALAPVLDVDVLGLGRVLGLEGGRHRDRLAVKVVMEVDAGQREQGGDDVRVGGGLVVGRAAGDARAAHDKGHVDVLLDARRLSRREPVLADVEAVVRGVDDVGVVEQAQGVELRDDALDQLVDGLQGLDAPPVEEVHVGDLGGIELGQGGKVAGAALLFYKDQ